MTTTKNRGHLTLVEQIEHPRQGTSWVVSCKKCAWVTGRDNREEADELAQEHREATMPTNEAVFAQTNLDKAAQAAQENLTGAQDWLDAALAYRRETVLALRADGWSFQRIADLLGITKTAAANICR